ncbi:EF-hand domain-containing protein [Oricola thermophila]|uniref:EF-hand domain-containing protein n=1 Tax=Oricola thermophila TaxID=2742145 RepID=A0A6N1VHH5_9HYPH|nr:EF-hand domain-containing protein [Oricola thermophila]QKV18609.1 EF-hand domain-containing protein [Oricola thermophila]
MKTTSKIAIIITGIAVSATAVASAYADGGPRGKMRGERQHYGQNMRGDGPGLMFQRADKDNSGTVTLEEFAAVSPLPFADADADGDGNIDAEELAARMEREMLRRRAERMIERFDTDNDGKVSVAEIENHRNEMFARLDVDESGEIEEDEMRSLRGDGPRRGGDRDFRHHRSGRN